MKDDKVTLSKFIRILQKAEAEHGGELYVGAMLGDYGWNWLTNYKLDKNNKGNIELI